jgi:hypothetical protein
MDIKKIVIHKDSSITVEFEKIVAAPEGDDPVYEKVTFKSNRTPQQKFYDALAEIKPFTIDMLEIDEGEITRVTVKGATFKRTKEGIMGVAILIERAMNHAKTPLRIETPHYIAESYSEDGDEENILNPDCVIVLSKLKKEATAYVNGAADQIEADLE